MEETKLRTLAATIERDFPLKPDRPRVVLFEQGPHRLQAQWIVPEDQESREPIQLRLLRLDRPQPPLQTISLNNRLQGVEQFPIEDLSCRYQVELGIVRAGDWQSLAVSNGVWLPQPRVKPQFPRAKTTLRPMAAGRMDFCPLPVALAAEPMLLPAVPMGEPPRFPSPCSEDAPPGNLPRFPSFDPSGISSS